MVSTGTHISPLQVLPSESGLRGLAHRFLQSRVPLKPHTEAELVQLLQRRIDYGNSVTVEVSGVITPRESSDPTPVGMIATFKHWVVCHARVNGRELIQFERPLFERFGSDRGFSDRSERVKASITTILAADTQAQRLKDQLPGAKVSVSTVMGPLTKDLRARIMIDARAAGIEASEVSKLFAA